MADQNEMTAEDQALFEHLYIPPFIEKCAALGLMLETEEQLNTALENAACVKMLLAKKANSVLEDAKNSLHAQLGLKTEKAAAPVLSKQAGAFVSATLQANPNLADILAKTV